MHFDRFIDSAKLFDHVFTVDENCIPKYKAVMGEDASVHTLMFAVQPKFHSFDGFHFNRGDASENVIRSTQSRIKYKGHNFMLFNVPETIKRGDIVIESSEYGHYAGEMMIALNDMKNTGKSNVVGRISEEEIFILDYIKPWQKFSFVRK